uniref:NADH-ubiquinone oxidoreductase chain 2 n=1 Tax=Fissurella volcano TaxID=707972 RepID=H6V546_FISVO|nr:NADH dehydrogenase subunit 2 [Fissurella volcano]AFB78098.1 NADH dehydrogenase subunit 2 [Fissurella volcano]
MQYLMVSDLGFIAVMLLGMSISMSSTSWLFMWAGMEVSLVGFLPLVCGSSVFSRGGVGSSESCMKYFIVQVVGSSLLFLGGFSVYSVSKMWDLVLWGDLKGIVFYSGPLMVIFGLGIKLGVFPFHFWVPSVMAGMGWLGCLVFTSLHKIVPVMFLCVVVKSWDSGSFMMPMLVSSVGSSIIGGLGGINQTSIRGLLGYSSINHMGWVLMCMISGMSAVVFYLGFYVLLSFIVFMVLWVMGCEKVSDINGSYYGSGGLDRLLVGLVILSYMGMPPFLGFSVKWFAISSLVEVFSFSIYSCFYIFLMFLGSLMSLSYYLGVFVSLVMSGSGSFVKRGSVVDMNFWQLGLVVSVFVGSFLLGMWLVFGGLSVYLG